MDFELIKSTDYHDLPDEPELKFVELESICRKNLNLLIRECTQEQYVDQAYMDSLRVQYMTIVDASAQELGIENIHYSDFHDDESSNLHHFMKQVFAAVSKIRLKPLSNNQHSVKLSQKSRAIIQVQIEKLRNDIVNSDLDKKTIDKLLVKLTELSDEIYKTRASYSKIFAVITFVAVATAESVSVLANAPQAIATITKIIGEEKILEDKEQDRLAAPYVPKALPAPKHTIHAHSDDHSLDDDIPF